MILKNTLYHGFASCEITSNLQAIFFSSRLNGKRITLQLQQKQQKLRMNLNQTILWQRQISFQNVNINMQQDFMRRIITRINYGQVVFVFSHRLSVFPLFAKILVIRDRTQQSSLLLRKSHFFNTSVRCTGNDLMEIF